MSDVNYLAVLIVANIVIDVFLAMVVVALGHEWYRALLDGQMLLLRRGEFGNADRRSQGTADAGTTDDGPA